jgi:DNA-binding transcriptional LysR family regulator
VAEIVDIEVLARTDVNLLVALEALMQERSVTRAAKRLAISQSAMSHTLGRLRELLGDELFVRSGQTMVPTPRALEMIEPVREALRKIGTVLRPAVPFDPATAVAVFRVSAFDFAQLALLPGVATALAERAPGIQLVTEPYAHDPSRALGDDTVDLVIGLQREPQDPCQRALSTERFACVLRSGHEALREPLTPELFAGLSHAVVSPVGRPSGYVDAALAELGLTRHVAFVTPQLLSAALAVSRSDMILTAAERQLRVVAEALKLALLEPPVALPEFRVAMSWHERRTDDPLHGFVRDRILEVAEAIRAEP